MLILFLQVVYDIIIIIINIIYMLIECITFINLFQLSSYELYGLQSRMNYNLILSG